MKNKIANERKLQAENPINNGSVLSITNLPINVLIGTAIIVDMNPVTAAAIPAICPTGCIASALKLPKRKPIQKN
jgi:hypothetical protein